MSRQFNVITKIKHIKNMEHNIKILDNHAALGNKYPYLKKVLRMRTQRLYQLIKFSKDKVIYMNSRPMFFVSCRFLSSKYGSHHSTWNRNINLFVFLGLVQKFTVESLPQGKVKRRALRIQRAKINRLNINSSRIKAISFYSIPLFSKELLQLANDIAKDMLDNGYTFNAFNKIWLIKTFGQETADKVYPDNRAITEYSNYVADEVEKFILEDIEKNSYTTKKRVLDGVVINYDKNFSKEYGFIKETESPKAIIKREFDRSIKGIVERNELKYRKANKELKETFKLDSYKWIIFHSNFLS